MSGADDSDPKAAHDGIPGLLKDKKMPEENSAKSPNHDLLDQHSKSQTGSNNTTQPLAITAFTQKQTQNTDQASVSQSDITEVEEEGQMSNFRDVDVTPSISVISLSHKLANTVFDGDEPGIIKEIIKSPDLTKTIPNTPKSKISEESSSSMRPCQETH